MWIEWNISKNTQVIKRYLELLKSTNLYIVKNDI